MFHLFGALLFIYLLFFCNEATQALVVIGLHLEVVSVLVVSFCFRLHTCYDVVKQ